MEAIFKNRNDAGQKLAAALAKYKKTPGLLVLGLPRGGVVVAYEVAKALNAMLDVFVVRKLGVPGHEELAMGAIASGGARFLNHSIVRSVKISASTIERITKQEERELRRREILYRGSKPMTVVRSRAVILVDDGLATGATMQAAVLALKKQFPVRIIVAVPVAAAETCAAFQGKADEILCLFTPEPFLSVGMWYEEFEQTTDKEVQELLRQAERDLQINGTYHPGHAA